MKLHRVTCARRASLARGRRGAGAASGSRSTTRSRAAWRTATGSPSCRRARKAAEATEAGRARRVDAVDCRSLGGYTRTNHVQEFGIVAARTAVARRSIPISRTTIRARLDLNWPVYSGGRTDALERAAEAEAPGDRGGHCRGALRPAARDHACLLGARVRDRIRARRSRARSTASAPTSRDLRSRFDQGLIPPNDVLSAEAQQSRQRVLAIEAQQHPRRLPKPICGA